jgi:hypothetical protein
MIFDHYEMKILKIKSSLIEELNTLAIFFKKGYKI